MPKTVEAIPVTEEIIPLMEEIMAAMVETAEITTTEGILTGITARTEKARMTETQMLKPNERIDDLQRNGLKIIQNSEKFCFGMDAVLLSGFVSVTKGKQLLDLGTGTGILPLLLSAKTDIEHLTGLEIQPESAEMAQRSVDMNNLGERISIVTGDIKCADELFTLSSMDVITCNPPYMIGQHGITNPDSPKAIARHEVLCTFDDVARVTGRLLKPGGHFYLVHRPFRLVEIMTTLTKYHLEPKRMRLVHPFADREPNMVLIEAVRGGNSRITVEKPLILFSEPDVYTDEVKELYGF